jgi:hypothetical protein
MNHFEKLEKQAIVCITVHGFHAGANQKTTTVLYVSINCSSSSKCLEYMINAELVYLCHSIYLDVSFKKPDRFLRGCGACDMVEVSEFLLDYTVPV